MIEPLSLEAQRLQHGTSRARTSRARTIQPQSNRTLPNNNRSRNVQRQPANQKRTLNGGSQINRPAANNRISPTTKNKVSRDKINIDNSRRNVNVNIDNSKNINIRNTRVRSGGRVYVRPPYRYGGFHFYAYHPYYYHPYRPFYWGPVWHPWGFFITTLAATAVIISIENQQYHYDQGIYYVESNGGYTVVQAPVGATVKEVPKETMTVEVNETTNNYYYGGTFYEKSEEGYTVVPATAGTIVPALPEGGEEVRMGEHTYVKFGETYYQPVQVDGKDMYEIVDMKEAD